LSENFVTIANIKKG